MANIRKLTTRTLNELALSNTFMYLLNTATNVESRISLSSLVGGNALSTGGGLSIYSGVVNNVLNFKSILSSSSILTIIDNTTDLTLGISPGDINLSSCDNATSLFLSTVDLTADVSTTILPVANGGTGAATLTDGGILLGSGTGAVTAMSVLAAGTIIQGDGTTDPTTLAIGAATNVLAVNAGATAVEWVAAPAADNLGDHTATTTLDMANNNIDLGTGWINKNGSGAYGFSLDSTNRAHFVSDAQSPTGGLEEVNISGSIFLQGLVDRDIILGPSSSGDGSVFSIQGSTAGTSSDDGGAINIKPGSTTSGTGGDLKLYGGTSTSATGGDIQLYATSGTSTTFPILRVVPDKKVSIQNSTGIKVPVGLLDVEQTEGGGAMPTLRLKQGDADFAFAQFTGTTAADSTMNLSTSTAEAAAKTYAIKIRVQNGTDGAVDGWIRVYASAV